MMKVLHIPKYFTRKKIFMRKVIQKIALNKRTNAVLTLNIGLKNFV